MQRTLLTAFSTRNRLWLVEFTVTHDLAEVTAVILAGGLGTRLRPVVADRPKALAEIGQRAFLALLLDQLSNAGVRDIVLSTGHGGKQIRETFGESYGNVHLIYSQESSPLGTGGALRLALPLCKSNPVLVLNGDSYCEADLKSFYAWHFARGASGTLLLTQVTDTKRYGHVELDTEGAVVRFDEKAGERGSGWISAGIYLLSCRLLLTIPEGHAVSLELEIFPSWIGRGLYGYQTEGRFLDIGTPEDYRKATRFFASKDREMTLGCKRNQNNET